MATEVHAHGLGESYKRKEDARFIRGQGNYVDDVQLPGMLYGDIVRSPYAHALIKKIDISEALKVPGVLLLLPVKIWKQQGLPGCLRSRRIRRQYLPWIVCISRCRKWPLL